MDVTIPLRALPALSAPWPTAGESLFTSDAVFWIHSMARIHEGTPIAALEAKLTTTLIAWLKGSSVPSFYQADAVKVRLLPGGRGLDQFSSRAGQPIRILTVVVALVLLLACVNLANLMLARGVAQAKEISIRLALGSGRVRLVRQALIESLILSLVGATIGSWIGVFGGRTLLHMLTSSVGPVAMRVEMNWRMMGLTALVACVATVLFAVFPAIRLARRDLIRTMKTALASRGGARQFRPAMILMAAQVAISVPLVAGAAIFLQTVHNLGRVDLGFDPNRLVTLRVDPSLSGYDRTRVEQIYDRILDQVRDVAGVSSATLLAEPLLTGTTSSTTVTRRDGNKGELYYHRVGPDYFATMGIPIVVGRGIEARDRADAPRAIVINETAAAAFFGSESPLGQKLRLFNRVDAEIVGVVRDTKYDSLRKPAVPTMFMPYTQTAGPLKLGAMYIIVRTAGAPAALTSALRRVVADVDRDVPISRMKTQIEQVQESLGTEIALTHLLTAFGAFALFLACIGLHGLTAYAVARRTSEIGLRIALGAQRGAVFRLIVRQALVVTVIGLAAGIPLAIAGGKAVSSLLFGVKPLDPVSFAAAAGIISFVAALAAYLPARRAARLEPLSALRSD
jgi:predicted permease